MGLPDSAREGVADSERGDDGEADAHAETEHGGFVEHLHPHEAGGAQTLVSQDIGHPEEVDDRDLDVARAGGHPVVPSSSVTVHYYPN